jgi:transcriptional regulator with XRE-family HTH domain
MLFKEKLLELRQAAGLTQKAAADRAGMSMLTYRNYEQGTRLPGLPAFMKIIKALGVPCEVFADCEDVAGQDGGSAEPPAPARRGRPRKGGKGEPAAEPPPAQEQPKRKGRKKVND